MPWSPEPFDLRELVALVARSAYLRGERFRTGAPRQCRGPASRRRSLDRRIRRSGDRGDPNTGSSQPARRSLHFAVTRVSSRRSLARFSRSGSTRCARPARSYLPRNRCTQNWPKGTQLAESERSAGEGQEASDGSGASRIHSGQSAKTRFRPGPWCAAFNDMAAESSTPSRGAGSGRFAETGTRALAKMPAPTSTGRISRTKRAPSSPRVGATMNITSRPSSRKCGSIRRARWRLKSVVGSDESLDRWPPISASISASMFRPR